MRTLFSALGFMLCLGAVTLAADQGQVAGTSVQYPMQKSLQENGTAVQLRLTGTALRKKLIFHVYAVASYLESSANVKSASELVQVDAAKQLHLILLRDLDQKDVVDAIREGVENNYTPGSFREELSALSNFMSKITLKKGDQVYITHLVGRGVRFQVNETSLLEIENVSFANAMWNIYLGPKNIGEQIKAGLTSGL